jgi:diguanylate cyclase (GGDEF)-like protein
LDLSEVGMGAARSRNRGLSLTLKMVLVVVAAGAFGAMCAAIAQTLLVLPSFTTLETREAVQDIKRVMQDFEAEENELAQVAWEGASLWESDSTPRMGIQLLIALNLDIVSILDSGGRVVWASALDPVSRKAAPLAELSPPRLSAGHPLVWSGTAPPPYDTAIRHGMMRTGKGMIMIASSPLLADMAQGPVRGTLLVGRFLSGALFDRLRVRAQIDFRVQPLMSTDALPAGDGPWIHLGKRAIEASSLIRDLQGSAIARLTIERPTDILERARTAAIWLFIPLLVALAMALAGFAYLMNTTILAPLDSLSRMVVSIRTTGTFVARLGLQRGDEIGTLARNFDGMLDQLAEKSALLEQLASTDQLTGILNRRAIMDALTRESSRAERYGLPLSVLMADIDYFKAVNDTHGHAAGDDVLAGVARHLAATVRDSDFAGRFGGEEFLIILPHQDAHGAVLAAERLRTAVAQTPMGQPGLKVTLSIGVGTFREGKMDEMLARADGALYEAKRGGRNRTVADPA